MLIADYIENFMAPTSRPHRTMMLLFRGDNPCKQLMEVCGHIYEENVEVDAVVGETIRDTYSDMIFSRRNPEEVIYFEPAVLTPRKQEEANENLALFARFLEGKGNIVQNMVYPNPSKVERTLVILKPDNWTYNSSRPGTVVDMFSRTGLRIVGIKVHRISLEEALEFYGPVESVLIEKLSSRFGNKAKELIEKEFGFTLNEKTAQFLTDEVGTELARNEFYNIVEFMSGQRPGRETPRDDVKCMILIYEGENAVSKIRDVLGPTDPLKAPEGTVRREFGSNIMVNTAHASDSTESYEREKNIVKVNENSLLSIIKEYLADIK
jgi:nucleoside diphosphate kinase